MTGERPNLRLQRTALRAAAEPKRWIAIDALKEL